jgi:hypothetical protein
MTEYLLSVWHADGEYAELPDPIAMQAVFAQVDAFNAEVQAAGASVFAGADLDAALEWAGKAAAACEGPVEVRPFQGE